MIKLDSLKKKNYDFLIEIKVIFNIFIISILIKSICNDSLKDLIYSFKKDSIYTFKDLNKGSIYTFERLNYSFIKMEL